MTNLQSCLLFAGDTHGHLDHLQCLPEALQTAPIIHLGDAAPLGGPVSEVLPPEVADRFWFIPGNHDFDKREYMEELLFGGLEERNLHGRVVEINGLRVAGLGGVFKQRVWDGRGGTPTFPGRQSYLDHLPKKDRGSLPLSIADAIWHEDVFNLMKQQADVLVTHEAPSCHRFGFSALDELAKAMRVKLLVHGHHHEYYQTEINQGQTRVMGVGLRGVCDLSGLCIVPGVLDQVRAGRWQRRSQ